MGEPTRSGSDEEPCTLRFCSLREGVTVRVLWVDYEGEETEYGRLEQSCSFSQDTYANHPWRLRDASSGQLLAEFCGPTATITLLPDGTTRIQAGLHRPPPAEITDPRWGTFRVRGAALGVPIRAFDCVCQQAVETAEHVICSMLAGAGAGVVESLVEEGAEVAIIGKEQVTTDLPMYRHLRGVPCGNGGRDFDTGTRGLGGNPGNPTTSCGEENLLMLEEDGYSKENILVHEFGHAVMDLGLHRNPLKAAIMEAYTAAPRRQQAQQAQQQQQGQQQKQRKQQQQHKHRRELAALDEGSDGDGWQGGYDPDCYMMANESEYWAEGSQAWFDATVRDDVTSGVNTREKLKQRDPALAAILAAVYGDGEWRYPKTAPRPFVSSTSSGKRQRTRGRQQQPKEHGPAAAIVATAAGRGRGGSEAGQIQVLVDNPMQPLLDASGAPGSSSNSVDVGGGAGQRTTRRRGGSPLGRRGKGGGGGGGSAGRGGKLAALPRRITRSMASLIGGCFPCMGVL